jgi:peptide/nickel transport system substrate-binding protein
MKTIKILLSILLIAGTLAACTPTVPTTPEVVGSSTQTLPSAPNTPVATPPDADKYGGTMIWGVGDEPPGFNPILNDYGTEIVIYQMTSEPLTWGGENFPPELRPILAESWEQSADGLTWTIQLRHDVKWSDGEPFTADDMLFWASVIQDPSTLGAEWVHPRFFVNDQPFKFEKVDDYTVKITTAAPVPTLLNNICAPLIPAHYFQKNNVSNAAMIKDPFNTEANIGTGPFIITSYLKGEAVILHRNDNYWGGKPYLDSIQFRIIPDAQARLIALQTGEIDFMGVSPKNVPDLIDSPHIALFTKTVDMQYHYRLNVSKPTLADKRTRQALYYALDRSAIVQALRLGYGEIADSPFNPAVTAYETLPGYAYDVQKAQQLLEEVGWVKGADGVYVADHVDGVAKGTPFTLVLDVLYPEDDLTAMTLAQSYWKALGIDASIRQIDPNVWDEENHGKEIKPYDVIWSGIGFIGDNGVNYQWLMASNKQDSPMSYENPEVNALFEQAKTTADVSQRDSYLKQAATKVWDDAPYLPIYYEKRIYASNDRLHFEDSDWQTTMVGIFGKPGMIWIEKP